MLEEGDARGVAVLVDVARVVGARLALSGGNTLVGACVLERGAQERVHVRRGAVAHGVPQVSDAERRRPAKGASQTAFEVVADAPHLGEKGAGVEGAVAQLAADGGRHGRRAAFGRVLRVRRGVR